METLESRQLLSVSAVISEFMAVNHSTLKDADGDYSDWIEIHNTSIAPVNLSGWSLTDDATLPDKWHFPAVTLAADGYLTVFASGKNRSVTGSELHTNFQLDGDGEYLALFEPDGSTIATAFAPFPAQCADISYGTAEQAAAALLSSGAAAKTLIPANDSLGQTWTGGQTFDDSAWTSGITGVGYDTGTQTPTTGYWSLNENAGSSADDASGNGFNGSIVGATWTTGIGGTSALQFNGLSDYVDLGNPAGLNFTGQITISAWIKPQAADGIRDIVAHGYANSPNGEVFLRINSGYYEVGSYTGTTYSILYPMPGGDLNGSAWVHLVGVFTGTAWRLYRNGTLLASANKSTGAVAVNANWAIGARGGGTERFFSGGIDDVAIWNTALTPAQITSLAQGVTPATYDPMIGTDVESAMRNVNTSAYVRVPFTVGSPGDVEALRLRMRYDDGFVVWLNGVEIARRNAPASLAYNSAATAARTKNAGATFEDVELRMVAGLLNSGTNVLAIQGLANGVDATEFLVMPELLQVDLMPDRYMLAPSPGRVNAAGILGFVADTKFSVDRGFFAAPFALSITTDTPGATIRYTRDGSTPAATTGSVYSGPLSITGTSTIRAAAFLTDYQTTDVDTETYIFTSDVKLQSPAGQAPSGWPSGSVNGQVLDYGMDPDIVNDPTWGPQIEAALTAIPTISIVTDTSNLFDPTTGIYVNAYQDGAAWERPASVELINPDGSPGFQIDAGIRIRGGYSRYGGNPKHAFRLLFDDVYDGDLDFPLFGDAGAQSFSNIDLRCSQNYSWSFDGISKNAVVRDIYSRDLLGAMGEPTSRGQPYQLYIDGQYWGLYETDERPEADYAASYFGGKSSDYDVIKVNTDSYTIIATDGTLDAWRNLWTLANAGFASNAAYYRVLGENPDGTRNPAYPVYVDQNNLIDYMINIFYTGNLDAPVSWFLGNGSPNNFYAIYNRNGEEGFKFIAHDSEHTLQVANDTYGGASDRTLNFSAGDSFDKSNPQWLHQQLMANPEYRMAFADRVQKYFFNGGLLTPAVAQAMYQARTNQISTAIIAESARWGDSKVATPYTKTDWQNAVAADLAWMNTRTSVVLGQLKITTLRNGTSAPLFPASDAPIFSQRGGAVYPNYLVTLGASAGTIYYTLDGSDPRLPGGGVSPSAQVYQGTTTSTSLVAQGATWKYLDNGSDQGAAWRSTGFNDAAWQSGPAQLGYGDGDEATTVDYGSDPNNKYITTYFRKTFTVTDPSQFNGLTLDLLRDDGAVIYINGQEVVRSNMPTGTIGYQTLAATAIGGDDETTNFYAYTLNPSLLSLGTNTIAVEIHQCAVNSSDISFDLRLTATKTITPTPITVADTMLIKVRALSDGVWSAIDEAQFIVDTPASIANLVVSELHYNPPGPTAAELAINPGWSSNDFEFVELKNVSNAQIDLTGVKFTVGVTFDFTGGNVTKVAPGDYLLVVKNLAAFEARYGVGRLACVAGEYSGSLSNSGETLTLADRLDSDIFIFAYGDSGDWPGRADGNGSSLELVNPAVVPTTAAARTAYLQDGNNWRSSREYGGTPAAAGTGAIQTVVVNEVLTHTDLPLLDSIELYNATDAPINIGGWYLSDSNSDYKKYRIPDGTVLAAHEYRVWDDEDFGTYFRLNAETGEDVWLTSADAAGNLTAFVDHVEFGAAKNGESFGRWPDPAGDLYPLENRTLGEPNDLAGNAPRIGPLLISEVMYKPSVSAGQDPDDYEYIEIFNPTDSAVALDNWHLAKGVNYDFAAGTSIGAHDTLVVLPFNPADLLNATKLANFKSKYGVAASVQLVGGFAGHLDDEGETVQLQRPTRSCRTWSRRFIPRFWRTRSSTTTHCPGRKGLTAMAALCSGWASMRGDTTRRVGSPPRPRGLGDDARRSRRLDLRRIDAHARHGRQAAPLSHGRHDRRSAAASRGQRDRGRYRGPRLPRRRADH